MVEIYPYRELCVRINNEHEYYELIDMLKKTRKPQWYNLDEIIENLPNYMFINFKGYNIELCYLTDDNIDDKVELLNDVLSEEHIDPNIYTIDDIKIIENIINTGKKYIKPTYQPKSKNKRLLENVNKYPYRFKTKDEFIEEYGEDWRDYSWSCKFTDKMDQLLGQPYPYHIIHIDFENNDLPNIILDQYYNCKIENWMLTENELKKPSYDPKINNRMLESYSTRSKVLSPDIQRQIFSIGKIVKVREDSLEYFSDVRYSMEKYLGKKVKITHVETLSRVYGSHNPFIYIKSPYHNEADSKDLVVTVEKVDDVDDNSTWYWYYRCFDYEPTYHPKDKIERTLENLKTSLLKRGKYKVISILINKYSEKIKFQNIIGDYLKTVISDPPICYVIFTEHIGSFRSDKVYTAGYNGDYMKYNFYRDKGHELNLNEDDISPVFNIDEFEQYYNNISKPSYKPKINKRLLEKYDINKVTNICVELNNRREINKIIELLEEYNFHIINELYNNDHLYLFINFINKSLSYCEFYQMDYDFENNSWLMDVWKKVLTINDIDTIKKIITNKVLFLPSYEPKEKPKRLLESKWFKLNNSIYLNKYKYRYVIFNFYTIEELHLFENYMLRFKDILSVDNFNYFINLAEEKLNSVYDHVYFRFFNKNGTLDFLWGTDDHNTDIDDYEKDFNIKDLTDGILENIIKYGSSIKSPTYQPKKINREL